MRQALIPRDMCGRARARSRRQWRLGFALVLALCALAVAPTTAPAQLLKEQKAFPKQKGGILGPTPKIDRAQPLYLQADQLIYDTANNRVIAQGNVEIYYNNYILTADQVIYDQGANKLIADGNAQLKDPNGSITRADRFEATDDFRDAFVQSLSVVTADDTRIAAERAIRREGNVNEFERGKFTPCKNEPGVPPLWCIGAQRIIHDQQAATITYQDAQFELFGVPILYLPYFQHPDPSVKRRSGFLMPSYANSDELGFGIEIPYYFALAPNYDFTFHPMYWSKQGVLWQGDWRHRVADGQYIIKGAAIDEDDTDFGWRGSVETRGQFSLSSWWRFGWDITVESDESFRRFYKLDPIIQSDRVNTVYLQGMSERNYFSTKLYHFGGLLLDDSDIAEAWALPVVDYNYIVNQPVLGGELSFTAHARALTRRDGTDSSIAVAEANWRRKMIDPIGQVWTPFANVRGEVASYQDALDPVTLAPIPNDTITRGVATAGATYSYPFVAHTASASHVLEPTAQIITRTDHNGQVLLPNEDARSLVFDDTLLFETDKFSGYDRFETGTRANVGMQYTFQTNTGFYGKAVFGQSFHLAGNNPYAKDEIGVQPGIDPATGLPIVGGVSNFNPASGLENDRSDYVAGLYLSPFTGLNLVAQGRFDESDWTLRRQDTYARASYGPVYGTFGYSFTNFDPELGLETERQDLLGGLGLRLTNNWSIEGILRYDIDARQTIQDQIDLKYRDECFVLTASYIETFVENEALDLRPDRTIMLRFELKHLGEFRYKTDALDHVFGDTRGSPIQ